MSTKDILLTVVLPALIAIIGVFTARWGGMSDDRRARRERLTLLTVACSFAVGARFVIGKWPALPPVVAEEWLFIFAGGALLASLAFGALITGKGWPLAGALLSVVFGACVVLFPLKTAMATQIDPSLRWPVGALVAFFIAAPMIAAGQSALRVTHAGPALALAGAIGAGAPGLFFSASVKFAQMAGVLAVCAGVFAVAALLWKKWEISRGTAGTIAGLAATIWALAYFYASAPRSAAILGALAPCAAAASFIPALRSRPRLCMTVQLALGAALAATATAIALQMVPKDDDLFG